MTAPMGLDGPRHGAWFLADGAQGLGPTLRPGDVVSREHLPAHQGAAGRLASAAAGARRRVLPPDAPDFQPLEQAFAKLQARLRQAAARRVDHLMGRDRRRHRPLHPTAVRQRRRRRRICCRLIGKRSRIEPWG
jgi:transposase